jgi:hypothetical protein
MKMFFSSITLSVLILTLTSCAISDKDAFFKSHQVMVASCPSDISVTVNDKPCITPCKLKFPGDTTAMVVTYNEKSTVVPTGQAGLYGYALTGVLFILDPEQIGGHSASPNTTYFIRDFELGVADPCSGS